MSPHRRVPTEVSAQRLVIALVVVAAVALVLRFEQLSLRDLAATPDEQLRLFTRAGWVTVIVLCIPAGGMLYLSAGSWR